MTQFRFDRFRRRRFRPVVAGMATLVAVAFLPTHGSPAEAASSPSGRLPAGSYSELNAPKTSTSLSVVLATPTGRLKTEERTVLRWLFDRPVAALGGIDEQLDPSPFVTITPSVDGEFRWASTRTLLFEPAQTLPLATAFEVTVAGLKALDGTGLAAPVVTRFETPRPQCSIVGSAGVRTDENDRPTLRMSCSPPVPGDVLAANTTIEFRPVKVSVDRYTPTPDELAAMRAKDPSGTQAFEDRLAAISRRTTVSAAVSFIRDEPCNPDDPDTGQCTVVALDRSAPADSRMWAVFGSGVVSDVGPLPALARAVAGPATPRTPFLVTRGCRNKCDPERAKPLQILGVAPFGASLDGYISVRNTETNAVTTYATPADAPADLSSEDVLQLNWATFEPGSSYEITVSKDTPTISGTLGYDAVRRVNFGRLSTYTQVPGGELVVEPAVSSIRARVRNVKALDVISRTVEPKDIVQIARSYAGVPNAEPLSLAKAPPTWLHGLGLPSGP